MSPGSSRAMQLWLFTANFMGSLFCKGQARQQSPSSFLIAEGCNHKGLTFFHQMM